MDGEVRRYLLSQIVELGPHGWLYRLALGRVNRFFTTGFLPQQFRDEVGLTWSPGRQRAFEIILRNVGRILARLPEERRLYPYGERLKGMRRRLERGESLV